MTFRVIGLSYCEFSELFSLPSSQLAARGARRYTADPARFGRMPCRVSLCDAEPGDEVILLNYEHLNVDTPYRSRYAIYVRQNACEPNLEIDRIPPVMQTRPLSLRAFDRQGMLLDAALAQGDGVAGGIGKLLDNSQVDFLHVHNAMHGCYAARVERA